MNEEKCCKRIARYSRLPGILFTNCLLLMSQWALAQYYETAIKPLETEQFKSATYRIWLPPDVREIRGIIVRQHGCGVGASKHGLNHANDLQWQALAQKHRMALLGTELTNDALCAQWFSLKGGSGQAFLRGLAALAITTHHPELTQVPWALWGHSGGGFWCTEMLFEFPERILCVIPRSGGYASMQWNPAVKSVPVMWMAGEKDIVDNQDYVRALTIKSFLTYRRLGAFWGLAIDPKADHGNRDGRSFYIPWMDAMLSLRLPASGNQPPPLDSLTGWLGDPTTYDIKPFGAVARSRNQWVWLPSETVARQWQEFTRSGWVTDRTPPAAPARVTLAANPTGGYTVQWNAQTDLESGIRQFNVYRNGKVAGTAPGQKSNFHDAPEPATVAYQVVLDQVNKGDFIYVTAVNYQGLESPGSAVPTWIKP
jgi:hypothetical protein